MMRLRLQAFLAGLVFVALAAGAIAGELEQCWDNPPRDARLRAYWWWLNGCVTKEAITRDLEEMRAKGFGGALICDADGSSQDGNDRAPHGPDFLSPEWRELYKHTLREADRLGLEMSLNIQSGWNLGGPMVTADDAAKKLVWSESRVAGPGKIVEKLAEPAGREGYYRDAFLVAYRLKETEAKSVFGGLTTSSEQPNQPLRQLADGDPGTFWVSGAGKQRVGPSLAQPVWVQFEFLVPTGAQRLSVLPRPGYGPRQCELQVSQDGKGFRSVKQFTADEKKETVVAFEPTTGRVFRLVVYSAFDRGSPQTPRNVQIAELRLSGPGGSWPDGSSGRRTLRHWEQKAGHKPLHFSAPDTSLLFEESPAEPGEADTLASGVLDLTANLGDDGTLRWDAPAGSWQLLRFGYTIGNHSYVSTSSEGWQGFAIDVLDAGAFRRYWRAVVEPLLSDAGPLAGKTLKYLHTDSWEVEPLNWTPAMRGEFQKRRGYDLVRWAPVLAGRIVEDRNASNRFLHDFRKTLGDLAIDNHYRPFRDGAHQRGLAIHPESGGPHAVPIDAQRCLGFSDAPMSEFWAWSWRHRVGDANRFFVKQPASAAHTYGRRLVLAEGFTTIGPHWQETLWDNLKPAFDKACCEGLNLLVWHAFVCSPAEQGVPGIQYFAGTHLNPNVTWWEKSAPFFRYINRCQAMLQRGLFVADACYYYGDHVPNFAQHKRTDPARVLPGYDYDVITEEVLLSQAKVEDGSIALPDGMRYRVLVLREQKAISLPVLRKLKDLVQAGATVVGPRPSGGVGLCDRDAEVEQLASSLRIVTDKSAREVLLAAGVLPDFQFIGNQERNAVVGSGPGRENRPPAGRPGGDTFPGPHSGGDPQTDLDYIHRRDGDDEIYFVANRTPRAEEVTCTFRVTGKVPELWDPTSGQRRPAAAYRDAGARTSLPLRLEPCGSVFVVFRKGIQDRPPKPGAKNWAEFRPVQEIAGPWQVRFDPKWGGPAEPAPFAQLEDWSKHANPGIRNYSGTAVYETRFDVPQPAIGKPGTRVFLDLGEIRELGEVRLNGKPLGIVWTPPFRLEITGALKPSDNRLEVEVVNFWPNRIIGDSSLPPEKRLTKTNIRKLTAETPLVQSGLFGPVRILVADGQ